ncbi:hypothetical protein Poli38472_005478 [Pythium oligandrum]|uniref:RING-type domain-containing protein n=1 Tax=Pythium oligandrum TaxID=41045 RepID=A0A8K1CGL4_PYTOL|nr:hypothetical protein Poli38472_005478 [Pythium oligandrum]|eukprot:TMW62860.1 hypothetical protein Poli38472_005478 [Pythium oligandrum]
MSQAAEPVAAFPASLAWIERGSVLVRRMNSERIAEDPRLRRLLITNERAASVVEQRVEEDDLEEKPLALSKEDSFEQVEASEGDQGKQESENTAPSAYKVLLWTYRVHASLQNALQYAVFAKASEDGYFVPIAPRVYCVAPGYLNTFTKLFDAHSSARQWNAAVKLLTQLDTIISKRFDNGACLFDCGLLDGVKRLHHKPLVYDEFCDGRIASIAHCRGPIPSMHSAFVVASTVSAWLDLNPDNVAILVAPNNEQMSVFATCCTLYSTEAESFPSNFPRELLEVYQQHIRGSETLSAKLSRTFSGMEAKNVYYAGGTVPKPQARFVADFATLLEMRDQKLLECADAPDVQERKKKLTGVAVTPAPQTIYIHEIRISTSVSEQANGTSENGGSDTPAATPIVYRPYFVLQNEKGVLFSSMIHGVRDANLSVGSHVYRVGKTLQNCGDFCLKMYHLPFGRQGELIFDSRLHATLLLERMAQSEASATGEVTLSVANGDFDCLSTLHILPKDFVLHVRFAREASAFPAFSAATTDTLAPALRAMSMAAAASPSLPPRVPVTVQRSSFASRSPGNGAMHGVKPVRYDGPPIVSFLLDEPNVRTVFGDVILQKIDVIRRVTRGHLDLYLLFWVDLGEQMIKVLPYHYLFRYILPGPVREKMLLMGATEESLNESTPSSFDVGTGMTFDEEYARWLQHLYDTDLNNALGTFDGELSSSVPVTEAQPGLSYRSVSIPVQVALHEMSSPPPPARPGRPQPRIRGAHSSLIHQLPTYIYRGQREHPGSGVATPDCLICRCGFEDGEEIKSLPCFHSYHSDCIDSWLSLNQVCPVCQFSIDNMHHSHPEPSALSI